MNLFQTVSTALKLWQTYGSTAESVIKVVQDLAALDGGRFFENIDGVLKNNGIDLAKLVVANNGAPDLTTVVGIRKGLNLLNAVKVSEDGFIDSEFSFAVKNFQSSYGLKSVDGVYGPETAAALANKLADLNTPFKL